MRLGSRGKYDAKYQPPKTDNKDGLDTIQGLFLIYFSLCNFFLQNQKSSATK
jgi:hypothetical protein